MVNRDNYKLVKLYLNDYLLQVRQLNPDSVRRYWCYLKHLLLWADETHIGGAHKIRPVFASYLTTIGRYGGEGGLTPATIKKAVRTAQRFLRWAATHHPLEFRELPPGWVESLQSPRFPRPVPEHDFVELETALQLAALQIEKDNIVLRRDQAAAAMLFLSGMRVGALGSLPIEAVDIAGRQVRQHPSLGVRTKNGKAATTYMLELPELLAVVEAWDSLVREQLPPHAMWCAPTVGRWEGSTLSAAPPGKSRNKSLARGLRRLFAAAGLSYQSPHKFRHGYAVYALQRAKDMADYKAISMNLMHEDIQVTDAIYAPLASAEVHTRIAALARQPSMDARDLIARSDDELTAFVRRLAPAKRSQLLLVMAAEMAA